MEEYFDNFIDKAKEIRWRYRRRKSIIRSFIVAQLKQRSYFNKSFGYPKSWVGNKYWRKYYNNLDNPFYRFEYELPIISYYSYNMIYLKIKHLFFKEKKYSEMVWFPSQWIIPGEIIYCGRCGDLAREGSQHWMCTTCSGFYMLPLRKLDIKESKRVERKMWWLAFKRRYILRMKPVFWMNKKK